MAITNYTLEYAVEIDSGTALTVPALGMTNGLIKFITGNGDTTSLVYENNSSATDFKKGFLVKDAFRGISKSIDLEQAGSFASVNTMSFTINNVNTYDYQLDQNEVFLNNAEVKIYVVLDDKLYQRWTGTINAMAWDTTEFTFTCKDYDATLFKPLPIDPTKPVTLGNISYAKLVKDSSSATEIFSATGAKYYESVDDDNKTVVTLDLYVSKTFAEEYPNADNLKNLYVRPRQFGVIETRTNSYDDAIRITGNKAPVELVIAGPIISSRSYFVITVYLETPFTDIIQEDMISAFDWLPSRSDYNCPILYSGDTSKEKYKFDIIKFSTKYYVSNGDIGEIETDTMGIPITYIYNENTNSYVKSNAVIEYVTTSGTPYFNLKANSDNITVKTYNIIRPDEFVEVNSYKCDSNGGNGAVALYNWNAKALLGTKVTNWTTGTKHSIPSTSALSDGAYDSFIEFKTAKSVDPLNGSLYHYDMGAYFKMRMSDDFTFEDYDGVYLGYAYTSLHPYSIDDYYNLTSPELNVSTYDTVMYNYLDNGVEKSKPFMINPPLNDMYFKMGIGDTNYDSKFTQAFFDGNQENLDTYTTSAGYTGTISPKCKLALTIEDAVDSDQNNFNGKVIFGQYYKRNNSSEYIESEQNIMEQFSIVNNPIVNENGNKFIYLWMNMLPSDLVGSNTQNQRWDFKWFLYDLHFITMKSISGQDIYVKTTGEQYNGGSVDNVFITMKYLFEYINGIDSNKMDYTNLPLQRVQWDTSRYINEQQSSQEYITDLARQSFVGIFVDRLGKFKLNAWREDTTAPSHIHNEETILNGSIKYASQSSQNYVYNDFTLNYSENYATNSFEDKLYITSADGVGGFYTDYTNIPNTLKAYTLWEVCNDSYVKNKVIKPLTSELNECKWYRDLQEYDPNAQGVMNQSIIKYLENLVYYNTQQKNIISYSIPLTPENLTIELLDRVTFSDPFITYNIPVDGVVTSYEIDTLNNSINIEIITESRYVLESPEIIDEDTPDILSIIDEDTVITTNIIDEQIP